MKFNKDDLKSLALSIIGNFIFQFICSIISSISLLALIRYILSKFITFTITYFYYIIGAILFIIIECFMLWIFRKVSTKLEYKPIINDEIKEEFYENIETVVENEDQNGVENIIYADADYYFEDYTKHVTIYKNGNGIIMNTFNIVINNTDNFKEFKRKINVEDGKKDIVFPSLSKMKAAAKDNRFSDFGFWIYKPKNSIIASVIEKYWADNDPDEEDHISKENPKELRWVFTVNKSIVRNKKDHKISYAISVPGLYPLEKGEFNADIANEPQSSGKASSSIHVEHYIKKITYIVSFENGVKLETEPECYTYDGKKHPVCDFELEEGVFYNKYIFRIEKPSYGTNVVIKWKFKGGDAMDKEGGD